MVHRTTMVEGRRKESEMEAVLHKVNLKAEARRKATAMEVGIVVEGGYSLPRSYHSNRLRTSRKFGKIS